MVKFSLSLPSMFGDHHVSEVRRILTELEGVGDIYASSCFRTLELDYDPARVDSDAIKAVLQSAGYLEDIPGPVEIHASPADRDTDRPFFRHTTELPNIQKTVSFKQDIPQTVRPLWPCPGLPQAGAEKEVDHA